MKEKKLVGMSHQQRALSWLSFLHTLEDFKMMQGKETFDALINKKKKTRLVCVGDVCNILLTQMFCINLSM